MAHNIGGVFELVIPPVEDLDAPVALRTLVDLVDAINAELAELKSVPFFEFGRGSENFVLYLRHPDGEVDSRSLRGPRGRQGRRGRPGATPEHEWSADGRRVRFRQPNGEWGEWSADFVTGERE